MQTYQDPWVAWCPTKSRKPSVALEDTQSLSFLVVLKQPVEIFPRFSLSTLPW